MAAVPPQPSSTASSLQNNHDLNNNQNTLESQPSSPTPLTNPTSASPAQPNKATLQHHHHHSASVSSVRLNLPTPDSGPRRPPLGSTTGSIHRNQKPGRILAFAAAALDKTIANISEPTIRPRHSSSALSRLSLAFEPPSTLSDSDKEKPRIRGASLISVGSSASLLSTYPQNRRSSLVSVKDPISTPYSETDPTCPPPIHVGGLENKMHQTSSRLLRMTDDERPFTKVGRPLK